MAQKITYWLLLTLVLSLGFGRLLYIHDILVLLLLILNYKGRSFVIPLGLKVFFVGLGLGWLRALTLYPISSLLIPSLYALRLLAYLVLFLQLKSSKVRLPPYPFLISGLTTLFIGLIQYFWLPDMRIFQYLGWDDHLNRLTLPHFDPTFTAVMLGLAFLSTSRHLPSTIYYLPAILFTYSRSVWLSLALTATVFIKNKIILLFAVSCLLLAIVLLPQKFGEGTNLLRIYSISSRVKSDLAYVQKYQWDLLIGRGMNTFILDKGTTHASGPNNSYLYLLATTGIFGLVGWGISMFSLYQRSAYKTMLVFFFLASLFNNVMFYPFSILWILLIESTVPTAT